MATRNKLKLIFKTGNIPTEEDFAELINSNINTLEDGIKKAADSPLRIQAGDSKFKQIIEFFDSFSKDKVAGIGLFSDKLQGADVSGLSVGLDNANVSLIAGLRKFTSKVDGSVLDYKIQGIGFQVGDSFNRYYSKSITNTPKGNEVDFPLMGYSSVKNESESFSKSIFLSNIISSDIYQQISMVSGHTPKGKTQESFTSSLSLACGLPQLESSIKMYPNSIDIWIRNSLMFKVTADRVSSNGPILPNIGSPNDFAELFESISEEDIPIGTAVVITESGMIRSAKQNEIPIGVISSNPAILGNSADEWPLKYLRDEFGKYLMEEVEEEVSDDAFLDQFGSVLNQADFRTEKRKIKVMKRKLNPVFDPAKKYTPREERSEWHPVGLLGQIHLRKGQPVAPTWVKIKDVSENVELWLVK